MQVNEAVFAMQFEHGQTIKIRCWIDLSNNSRVAQVSELIANIVFSFSPISGLSDVKNLAQTILDQIYDMNAIEVIVVGDQSVGDGETININFSNLGVVLYRNWP